MKAKQRRRSPERWQHADRNFAVATIALMIFFLVAGFSARMFGNPSTAAVSGPTPASLTGRTGS